jgi:hypothetical protein
MGNKQGKTFIGAYNRSQDLYDLADTATAKNVGAAFKYLTNLGYDVGAYLAEAGKN